MSLKFGHPGKRNSIVTKTLKQMKSLHYQIYFTAISTTMSNPYNLDTGFPHNVIFCISFNKDVRFVALTHKFDTDLRLTFNDYNDYNDYNARH